MSGVDRGQKDMLYDRLVRIEKKIDELPGVFVTHIEFWPVKAIVYSGAGAILLAVLGAIIGLVVITVK